MAMTLYSEDALFSAALSYFRLAFPTVDLSDKSFFGLLARAFARFMVLAQAQILEVDKDSVPAYQQDADGNIRSRCSSAALDAWAFVFGLPSGVPGIYGRRGATIATGGAAVPGVTVGAVVVPAGTQATDPTGQVTVETVAAVTLNGPPNTIPVQFVSVTKGSAANLSAGTVLAWISPPAGLLPQVTLTVGLAKAQDVETDPELVQRLLLRIQQPPRGGTAADYRNWGIEATSSTGASLNIFEAFVYPLRSGLGSVDLVLLLAGSGLGRAPSVSVLAQAQAALELVRPVTATVTVFGPYMPASTALRLRVKATPSPAKNRTYSWDWSDGGLSTTIASHTTNSITVAAVPPSLLAAFAAGARPRIQCIISTAGGSPLPFVSRVTNIAVNTITLETPFVTAPTDGVDYFYAGSSIVLPIATRLRDYIDSLGPSRQSGFADPNAAWEDRVLFERIADVVMETKDTDGTRMVAAMPDFLSTGLRLAVGTGAFAANPYTPRDVGFGIELCYLRAGGLEILQQ